MQIAKEERKRIGKKGATNEKKEGSFLHPSEIAISFKKTPFCIEASLYVPYRHTTVQRGSNHAAHGRAYVYLYGEAEKTDT